MPDDLKPPFGTEHTDWLLDGARICPLDIWEQLDWSQAYMDKGPSPTGNPGPYWHVPAYGWIWYRLYPRFPGKWRPMLRALLDA